MLKLSLNKNNLRARDTSVKKSPKGREATRSPLAARRWYLLKFFILKLKSS